MDKLNKYQLEDLVSLIKSKKWIEGEKKTLKFLKKFPNDIILLNLYSLFLNQNNNFNKSEIILKKILETDPKNTDAINNLGLVFKRQNKYKESIDCYAQLIRLDHNLPATYNNLGTVYKQMGDFSNAVINYNLSISKDPNFFDAYNNLGIVQEEIGNISEAIKNYNKCSEINPIQSDIYEGKIFQLNYITNNEIEKNIHFRKSIRPLIRWVKGEGLDDKITKASIAIATKLFGDEVDYCLCTNNLNSRRVREILSLSSQPVCWIPLGSRENIELSSILTKAGCSENNFGYWWKWFPERVRPYAPEWIVEGDMLITKKPKWFNKWKSGSDVVRISASDESAWPKEYYGEYANLLDDKIKLYSGFVSLPPNFYYLKDMIKIMNKQPLKNNHNGVYNFSEQGLISAVFSKYSIKKIPIEEFPIANALFENNLKNKNSSNKIWGYHFARSFIKENIFFTKYINLKKNNWIKKNQSLKKQFEWLRNNGQFGNEGYSMNPLCVNRILSVIKNYKDIQVLEIGTSRGYLTALLSRFNKVTTIDHKDRGAFINLSGLNIKIVKEDMLSFLKKDHNKYKVILIDLHGNSKKVWSKLWSLIPARLEFKSKVILYNSHLYKIDRFKEDNGIKFLLDSNLLKNFNLKIYDKPLPGMIICSND
jgi:tetratricopeptide (TPR) repeat protein